MAIRLSPLVLLALIGLFAPGRAIAQQLESELAIASHIIVPQRQSFALHRRDRQSDIIFEGVSANVEIVEQTAATTLELTLRNTSQQRAEAIVLLPIPDDAAVSGFMFEGSSAEPTAKILRREEARQLYDQIVAQIRDPALLEFAGYNLIRSSVFPIEPGGSQRIRLTYESVLGGDGNRIDYILPRSESLDVAIPWNVSVDIRATNPISMIYSPSHDLVESRRDANHVHVSIADNCKSDPGSFRLSYLLERDGVTASLLAYPDPKVGGGYFLLLGGLPASSETTRDAIRREVTLVLDRSGSMAGEKLDQVKAAALQIIEGLDDGEAFNIIDYSNKAEMFSKNPVTKNGETARQAREYLASLKPNGGTNIHDALLEALRQDTVEGLLPIVLFLTDGLPTVGRTSELSIRELLETGNDYHRRVFTFGVGADVNVPLLDRLADTSRAKSTYVLPGEDVEVKVAQTFRQLYGPVFADIELATRDGAGVDSTTLVRELIPSALPDVFAGDSIVLLGQYREDEPVTFVVEGNLLGEEKRFTFTFDFDSASTRNAFVPRLWASRRIAYLIDEIRQAGAGVAEDPFATNSPLMENPRYRELIDEIVRLSTEFGVLSEYTSFLATEGTNLGNWNDLLAACSAELDGRAVQTRSGVSAINQSMNVSYGKSQLKLQYDNRYWNADMQQVTPGANVQQMNDKAFIRQGAQWIDTTLVAQQQEISADRVVEFGSREHFDIVYALAEQNRQGCVALDGDILIEFNGENVLIRAAEQIEEN
jgi:Ca-activated chloride channel family protein